MYNVAIVPPPVHKEHAQVEEVELNKVCHDVEEMSQMVV